MAQHEMNPKVDAVVRTEKTWRKEFEALREIALACELSEELKWGCPCYTYQDRNVVLIHGFKTYCALLFFKGALLRDPEGILVRQTENVQAARQIRFTGVKEIAAIRKVLKTYIERAVALEKAGAEVTFKKTTEFKVPEELTNKFGEMPALKTAFEALTPGRQRAYLLHFSSPKQSATRVSRIEKCLPHILAGKGLNDDWQAR